MKITRPKSRRRGIIIALLAVGLPLLAIGGYFAYERTQSSNNTENNQESETRPVNSVDYGPSEPSDKIGDSSKDKAAEGKTDETPDTANSTSLTIDITNASQDSDMIYIRAIANDATNGECQLHMQRDGLTVTKTASLSLQASYGICQGFNVSKSEFTKTGVWQVKVTVTSGSKSGSAETSLEIT